MTVYDPSTQLSLVGVGGSLEGQWGVERFVVEMAAAGFISLTIGNAAPADTTLIWLHVAGSGPQASPGIVKAHNGSAWVAASPTLLLNHLGGNNGGAASAVLI